MSGLQGAILQCKQLWHLCVGWEAPSEVMLETEALGLLEMILEQLPELRALQWLAQDVTNTGGDPDVFIGPKHYSLEFVRKIVREHIGPGLVLLQTDNIQVQELSIKADKLEYLSAFKL